MGLGRAPEEPDGSERGVEVGPALTDFEGVIAGVPSYRGGIALLDDAPPPGSGA